MSIDQLVIFTSTDSLLKLSVTVEEENIWLSLKQIAELFERDKSVISKHIKKIFAQNELDKNQVVAFFATTATDGKVYQHDLPFDSVVNIDYQLIAKTIFLMKSNLQEKGESSVLFGQLIL